MPVTIRRAVRADLSAVRALLESVGLPTEGVSEHFGDFVVALSTDGIVGVGGLEVYPEAAILRSLAVAPGERGKGLATRLCDRLEEDARRRGARAIYLLTETAERFFARRGYEVVNRADAPDPVARSPEFSRLCPSTAACLRLRVVEEGMGEPARASYGDDAPSPGGSDPEGT